MLHFFFTFFFDLFPTCLCLWCTCWQLTRLTIAGLVQEEDLEEALDASLVACLDANLGQNLDVPLDSNLDADLVTSLDGILELDLDPILDAILDLRLLETGTEIEPISGGGSNGQMDLWYVGGVERELIVGRDTDLETFFCRDPRVIASLGIEDMESRFNPPPVENPSCYHL